MHDRLRRLAERWSNAELAKGVVPSRRRLLQFVLAAGALPFAAAPSRAFEIKERPRFSGYPFTLGVASGYPKPDSVVIWTRLAPAPLIPDGNMPLELFEVAWEVASDEAFGSVVAKGKYRASPDLAHSVRATVTGLAPGRTYFYRFRCGDEVSPVGRTRTAPAADAVVDRVRFPIASCQHFEQGYFSAYKHMLADDPDFIVFLGDYIYEVGYGTDRVRRYAGPAMARTLAEYRQLHAQYKTDRFLQEAHRQVPFVLTWDDHEVNNDYATDRSEFLDPDFLSRRASAYQAYFEHLPLGLDARPRGADMRIYQDFAWGRLGRFYVLDDRQYRDPQPCSDPAKGGGGSTIVDCKDREDPRRSLLGREQEAWLAGAFGRSRSTWNFITQQTLMCQQDAGEGSQVAYLSDNWDGYPAARNRLWADARKAKLANPVVLGGDIHASVIGEVHEDFSRPGSPVVAAEFVGTSVTAEGWSQAAYDARLKKNPHLKYANSASRGYIGIEASATECRARVRTLESEKKIDSAISTAAEFRVEAGRMGVTRVDG